MIFSFRKFHEIIVTYGRFVKNYTLSFEKYMAAFMLIINHIYLFLVPVIILLARGLPQTPADYAAFAFTALFYLMFSFSLATPFTKLMYVSQNGKIIADGIERMDRLLNYPPSPLYSIRRLRRSIRYRLRMSYFFIIAGEVSPAFQPALTRRLTLPPLLRGSAP